jgi:hypothetical protein
MMMKSMVYYLDEIIPGIEGIERLFKALDPQIKGDIVAVKVHMGEYENFTHLKPFYVQKMVELIKEVGGEPFVTDTTTIYGPMRNTALGYHEVARAHGFSPDYLGCAVIIADGLKGDDGFFVDTKGNGTEIEGIEVARSIYESDALLVLSHATGHSGAGFGGAIKNIGMGCVTKKGKEAQHEVTKPLHDVDKCTKCGECAKECPYNAISSDLDFEIDEEKCNGCGRCLGLCPNGVKARYTSREQKEKLQMRIAEAAFGVLKVFATEKVSFFNFLMDITLECDCARSTNFISPNIGVLASNDIVAVDKSTVDMIKKKAGEKIFMENFDIEPGIQLKRASELGMGSIEYEIEEK